MYGAYRSLSKEWHEVVGVPSGDHLLLALLNAHSVASYTHLRGGKEGSGHTTCVERWPGHAGHLCANQDPAVTCHKQPLYPLFPQNFSCLLFFL